MSHTTTCKAFIEQLGLSIRSDGYCQSTQYPGETLTDNIIAPLTQYGFLSVKGPDAAKFLQGQTTCNITTVDDTSGCSGAYCSPKGRVLSSFLVARTDTEQYLLRMQRSIIDSSKTVLGKYIVFSKAEIADSSDQYLIFGLYGPNARESIKYSFGSCPEGQFKTVCQTNNLAIQLDDQGLLFECWVNQSELESLWPKLNAGLELCDSRQWQLLTIRRGIGEISSATIDLFIPQMLNYQITGAINFKKGCYTGQEVVARMHYKGKLKRHMHRIGVNSDQINAGDELFSQKQNKSQSIGNIVDVISTSPGYSEALAVITSNNLDEGDVAAGEQRASIELLSLPYAINKEPAQ